MEKMMNIQVAIVTKRKLQEVIGMLVMAEVDNDAELIRMATCQLVGFVKGLEIVINNDETEVHDETIKIRSPSECISTAPH
jgi:hypothetical protein